MPRDVVKGLESKYAWVVMASAFCVQILSISLKMCGAMLMVEYSQTFDASMATIGASFATFSGVSNFSGFWMGSILHKYGARRVCIVCSLLAATGLFTTAFVTNIYYVFFTYGVLAGLGDIGFLLSSTVIVQQYFNKNRALAGGLITVGVGVGASATGPLYVALIGTFGWRGAVIIHSGLILNGVVLGALFRPLLKSKTADSSAGCATEPPKRTEPFYQPNWVKICGNLRVMVANLFDTRVIKNHTFQLYAAGTMGWVYGMLTFYTFLPSWGASIGLNRQQIGLSLLVLGVSSTGARLFTSFVANMKCTNRTLLAAALSMTGALPVIIAAFSKSYALVLTVAGLAALIGSVGCVQSTVLVDLLGKDFIAKSQGWLYTFSGICGLICLPISGWLFEITGSYTVPYLVAASIQLLGGFCILVIFFMKTCSCYKDTSELATGGDIELSRCDDKSRV